MSDAVDIVISLRGSSAATLEKKANALDRVATSTMRLATAAKMLPGSVSSSATALTNYGKRVQTAGAHTDRFGTQVRGAGNALDNFRTLFARMVRIMTAFFVITLVTRAVREFTETLFVAPARMELWSTQLTVLAGNATIAAEKLALLKDVAIDTPLELPDLFQGLTTLRAFNVEISDRTLRLLADLAAVSGRTFSEIAEVAGKVIAGSAPAITRSLPTVGINPNEFKAQAAEMGNRADALFSIIETKFKDFALRSAKTTIGLLSNIKDAFFVVMASIGEGVLLSIRPAVEAVFDALQNIRNDPAALAKIGNEIAGVVQGMIRMGEASIRAAQYVGTFVEVLGGLRSILIVIGGVVLAKMVAGLVGAVAAMNPLVAVAILAGTAVSVLIGHLSRGPAVLASAARAQDTFANSLKRTNDLYRENLALVDAGMAKRQASTLAGMVGDADVAIDAGPSAMAVFAARAARVAAGMDSHARIPIMEAANFITTEAVAAMNGDADALAKIRDRLVKDIMQPLSNEAMRFMKIGERAKAAAIEADFSIGEIIDTDTGGVEKAIDFLTEYKRAMSDTVAVLRDPVMARFSAGLISRDTAMDSLANLREQLASTASAWLTSGDPALVKMGVILQLEVQGLTGDIDNLHVVPDELEDSVVKGLNQAFESAIRQSVQKAADTLSMALASMISPRDGETIAAAMATALSSILNLFGDLLIQVGIAAIGLQNLFKNPLSLPLALAAIGAGVALKAFAGSIANSMSDKTSSSGGSARSGPASFPSFTAGNATAGPIQVNISTMDAKGVKAFIEDNIQSFGEGVKRVASMDNDTNGGAFGVFVPAR